MKWLDDVMTFSFTRLIRYLLRRKMFDLGAFTRSGVGVGNGTGLCRSGDVITLWQSLPYTSTRRIVPTLPFTQEGVSRTEVGERTGPGVGRQLQARVMC